MRKRTLIVSAVAIVAVLVAGGLFASNMGFKLNYAMERVGTAVPGGTSRSGSQTLALPYNQQTDIVNQFQLITDMGGTGIVAQVGQYIRSTDSFALYNGTAGVAPALIPGEGYLVTLQATAPATINYIVVGSHNPGLGIDLFATAPGVSRSGQNLWSYPYHSTNANGFQLINEINAFAGAGTVSQIGTYVQSSDSFALYNGTAGVAPNLVPGEAVLIGVNGNVSNWIPSHY
jgi:hypothetical protein